MESCGNHSKGMLISIIDFQTEGNLCLFEAGYYLSINLRLINILSRLRVVTKISFFRGGGGG